MPPVPAKTRVIALEEHYSREAVWQALDGVGKPVHQPDFTRRLLDVGDGRRLERVGVLHR